MAQVTIHPRSAPEKPPVPLQQLQRPSAGAVPTIAYVRTLVATQAEADQGWRPVVIVSFLVWAVLGLEMFLLDCIRSDKSDKTAYEYYKQVPRVYYQFSAAAFATATGMNALSFWYELSPLKRQAAVIQMLIKGLSFAGDFQMGYLQPFMCIDTHSNVLIPVRFAHWAMSCPLIIWLVVRISESSKAESTSALITSVTTVLLGALAQVTPWPWRWIVWCTAVCSQYNTMRCVNKMLKSVEAETVNEDAQKSIRSIRLATLISWQVFPIADFLKETRLIPRAYLEFVTVVANFYAKVIFSSTVMYANFVTSAERKAIREELDKQLSRVNLVEELQRALDAKEEFMSMVSHELRTPLNGLIGLSEAMLGEGPWQLGDLGSKYMRTIKTSSIHLASLINDILDAAAANKGSLAIKLERAHLDKIVQDVMDVSAQLVKKNVSLVHEIDPATPVIIADKKRLTQILFNLTGNALKFTHHGTVMVHVKPASSGSEVIISITDTGCGIPPDKQAAIFEPFNQGDSTTTRKYGGTGLGLNIVQRLVAAHNGSISVKSAIGKGSTFAIRLPVHQANESQCPSALESSVTSRRDSVDTTRTSLDEPRAAPSVRLSASIKQPPGSRAVSQSPSRRTPYLRDRQSAKLEPIRSQRSSWEEADPTRDVKIAAAASLLMPPNLSKAISSKQPAPPTWGRTTSFLDSPAVGDPQKSRPASFSGGNVRLGSLKPTYSEVHGDYLILSIDDEPTNHMVINEMIRSQGYTLHEELDGRLALNWMADQPELPDLILLDCMMPGMDGHEVCRELRKTVPGSLVPIIMLSAKNSEENIVEGLQNGCNDFCSKPIKRAELLARIGAHLRMKADATWVNSLVNGAMKDDAEAMKILKSILPETIIHRIQEGQRIIGDSHPHVVILFSDIVGFSTMATDLPAIEVFMLLTNLYATFDKLVDKYSVYKVETIGDGYMIAAGHDESEQSEKQGTPVERMLKMARAMMEAVRTYKVSKGTPLRIRIGMHCGPAFAGVIGSKCPRYCFLGDTVNTASRMESTSFPMAVQVSKAVADDMASAGNDVFHSLGERNIKGKGMMSTFLLKAGDWQAAKEAFLLGTDGEVTPPPSRSLKLTQTAVGQSTRHRYDSMKQDNSAALQHQVIELQQRLQEEKEARQTDATQITELSTQLADASAALQRARADSPSEAMSKLQVQLLAAQHALELERSARSLHTFRSVREVVQSSHMPATPRMADSQNRAVVLHDTNLPLIPVEQVWAASTSAGTLASMSQVVRIQQGPQARVMVVSAGYSVSELLRDIGLQEYLERFMEENIRLETLHDMDHADLADLGVSSRGDRRAILTALQNYLHSYVRIYLRSCDMAASQPTRAR